MAQRAHEIAILRRVPGYARLHIPPLIYSGKAAFLLERELLAIDGVRRVTIKKELGKVSIHYDPVLADEREILLTVDRIATPLVREDQVENYHRTLKSVLTHRRKRLVGKAVVSVLLIYLVKLHWRLLTQRWLRNPLKYWAELGAIGALIYLHRKQIRGAPSLD